MKKILLIIDVQNDFCTGGNLEVNNGEQIIPGINQIMNLFDYVIATQDWHPKNHCSFKTMNGPWPEHCVQGTYGADFHKDLDQTAINFILRKGYKMNVDSYSAFIENDQITKTLLSNLLDPQEHELFVVGLALDYCVKYTVLDGLQLGYKMNIIQDLTKSIGNKEDILKSFPIEVNIINIDNIVNQFQSFVYC